MLGLSRALRRIVFLLNMDKMSVEVWDTSLETCAGVKRLVLDPK